MDGENPKKELERKDKNALLETWLMKKSIEKRHETFKKNYGKVIELIAAEFLFKNCWKICNLEALGAEADIIGISPKKKKYYIEVKYIGQENEDFALVVKSICGNKSGGFIDHISAVNYLMYITYTAAKQLEKFASNKIAIIVISNMNWIYLKEPLEAKWIDWSSPKFFDDSAKWINFLQSKKKDDPNIESDMKPIINSLSELWIIKEENFMEFSIFESFKIK